MRAGVRPQAQLSSSSPAPGTCRYDVLTSSLLAACVPAFNPCPGAPVAAEQADCSGCVDPGGPAKSLAQENDIAAAAAAAAAGVAPWVMHGLVRLTEEMDDAMLYTACARAWLGGRRTQGLGG
eukprot:CAMPEP_0202422104 /NCGR_PEP_ID=MMETSP1128-20130828/50684_1 /ASSEMBLY_ACC=CAM_ASM_000463 /TAXON_ID=3047 /ORGANISM="Dunaliella tertiolecta, Strain CCMP1320" /LENGTH=122 /DNA_ID=CAMNT_0049030151 /DNA_START=537 /DNA_END=906 /DNA_ORIENTATION=+